MASLHIWAVNSFANLVRCLDISSNAFRKSIVLHGLYEVTFACIDFLDPQHYVNESMTSLHIWVVN